MLPAKSLQVALSVSDPPPNARVVLVAVQLAGSIPTPPALSVQCQVTVTSVLFQPAALAAGDWVGLAVDALVSVGLAYSSALAR